MSTNNPFVQHRPQNEPCKGFIRFAQIFAVFIFVFIVAVFIRTRIKMSAHLPEMEMALMQMQMDSIKAADSYADVAIDISSESADAALKESENDSLYARIRRQTPDMASEKAELFFVLNVVEKQTDAMCKRLRDLKHDFNDTLSQLGNPDDWQVTEKYFMGTGRAARLRLALIDYRQSMITQAIQLSGYTESELKEAFPLDDADYYGDNLTWDIDKFSGSPTTLNEYFNGMEAQVRDFENKVLNQLPYSYTSQY